MQKNSYNLIAKFYDAIHRIVFGNSLLDSQKIFIEWLPDYGNLLIIGGGSGKILKTIHSLKPQLHIYFVDASLEMIKLAKKQSRISNQVTFIHGNENSIPKLKFDAIATFYFLDLFEPQKMNQIANRLFSYLKQDGLWLISDFNQPKNRLQKLIEKTMFYFFKITTNIESKNIGDYHHFFKVNGMMIIADKEFYDKFIFSRVYRKTLELKDNNTFTD